MSQYCVDCKHRVQKHNLDHCRASQEPFRNHVTGKMHEGFMSLRGAHRSGVFCNDFEQKPPSVLQRIKARIIQ